MLFVNDVCCIVSFFEQFCYCVFGIIDVLKIIGEKYLGNVGMYLIVACQQVCMGRRVDWRCYIEIGEFYVFCCYLIQVRCVDGVCVVVVKVVVVEVIGVDEDDIWRSRIWILGLFGDKLL